MSTLFDTRACVNLTLTPFRFWDTDSPIFVLALNVSKFYAGYAFTYLLKISAEVCFLQSFFQPKLLT